MAKTFNINELARRYTTAVLALAKSGNKLDAVAADLEAIRSSLLGDEKLVKTLNSPLLTAQKQVALIKESVKSLSLEPITQNFLLIVARNRRLGNLSQIIEAFQAQISAEKGEVKVQITSAEALEDAQIQQIAADLGKKTGKKIVPDVKVDKSIIGGLIVKIGSMMYDYSVKTKLNRLAQQLKKSA